MTQTVFLMQDCLSISTPVVPDGFVSNQTQCNVSSTDMRLSFWVTARPIFAIRQADSGRPGLFQNRDDGLTVTPTTAEGFNAIALHRKDGKKVNCCCQSNPIQID